MPLVCLKYMQALLVITLYVYTTFAHPLCVELALPVNCVAFISRLNIDFVYLIRINIA